MKPHKLLVLSLMIFWSMAAFSQSASIHVSGHVTDQQTQLPIGNHMVAATVSPDSLGWNIPYSDSALTDASGMYSLDFVIPFTPGTVTFFTVGTPDCMNNWIQEVLIYTPNLTNFNADFSICSDSIPPPSSCQNYILGNGVQGLTVSLQGGIYNGLAASYFWNLGDGTSASGQNVTHTYPQQGVYNVLLQTVTPDSCTSVSSYMVVLMDSINPPSNCENYITAAIQGLTVSYQGNMVNGQSASYTWELGDGTSATGQNVVHTYALQGFYSVTLQTITANGCMALSTTAVVLGDSINGGCTTFFMATPTINPFEIAFHCIMPNTLPVVCTWEFGDGSAATGLDPVHTYCCSGIYMVLLTTTNSLGCTATYMAPVVISGGSTGNLTLSGQVFAGNTWLAQGNVTLFGTDPATGYFYPVQNTYIDSVGFYTFQNVNEGTYLILAFPAPQPNAANQYLPTFYGNVIFWEQASAITLGIPMNPYNINLVSFDSINGGGGIISGQLLGGGKSMLTAGQEVLLLDASGNTVRIAYTDAQGHFTFASLPFGEYQINPMITGSTTLPAQVTLSTANPSANVIMTVEGHTITGISKGEQLDMIENIYPNPAVSNISVNIKSMGLMKVQIVDASGKIISVQNSTIPANGKLLSIPVAGFAPGLYFLLIQDEKGNSSSRRFLKN